MSEVEKIALKMAITGFIASIGFFINLLDVCVNFGAWYLFHINFPSLDTYYLLYNVGNCIYVSVNPYAMFLFSGTVRHRFAELFCRAWHPYDEPPETATTAIFRSNRVAPIGAARVAPNQI
jgi:hypothetical protein